MQAAPQPLLVHLPILPQESLFSFLVRLPHSNSYISPKIIWDLILGKLDPRKHHRYVKDRLDFPLKTETYNRIATLTMTDILTLYTSTYHRFVLVLIPPPHTVSKNDPGRHYKLLEIMTYLENLSRYVKSCSPQELAEKGPWIDFAKAQHIFFYKESFQAATILLQILEENLVAYHSSEGKFQLKSLLFTHRDFQACIVQLRDQSMWLEHQEVMSLLGIKDSTLTQWIRNSHLLPIVVYKCKKYFYAVEVYEMCSKCATKKEAAHILGVNIPTLQSWIRSNQMPGLLTKDLNKEGDDARIFDK